MKKKIVYIAHPIGGDVKGNIDKVLQIVRRVNLSDDSVVPFAPYIVDCLAMNDNIPEERSRGIANDHALFVSGVIDEVWLFGDRISAGMQGEIDLANSLGIKVVDKREVKC